MLQPSRQKFRKMQKGRNKGIATTGNKVSFGDFGLKAIGRGRISARQIEAARRVMTRHIKRGGRVWIRIFPISRFLKNLLKCAWVKVKVVLSFTSRKSSQVKCYTRWTA